MGIGLPEYTPDEYRKLIIMLYDLVWALRMKLSKHSQQGFTKQDIADVEEYIANYLADYSKVQRSFSVKHKKCAHSNGNDNCKNDF